MKKIISFLSLFILLTSCSNDGAIANLNSTGLLFEPETNKVLLLKVDYTTNTFEGGKELTFDSNTTTFSTNYQYVTPADFGSIKIFYKKIKNNRIFQE